MFKCRLKELREKLGMSQTRLAESVYVTQQMIAAYEAGIRMPNLFTLGALADALECTTDYLLGRTEK